MKIANRIKRDTIIVVVSVIALTICTMRVAYSAVFSVKSQSIQQISSGTLNVEIDSSSSDIGLSELMPVDPADLPTSESPTVTGEYASLVIKNTGSLNSAFSVSITYDIPSGYTASDFVSFDYLIIGIYDVAEEDWISYGAAYYTVIGNLEESETNVYPVLGGTINAQSGASPTLKQYHVYIWLKDDTPVEEIGKLANLKLNVKSTTINDGVHS